ncbi:expressed unknown protein [Seminavis robusta]|uniref:HMG box domain-containing protein n=1 Tax=Seminavis robusta TaxID=568900 RepID=A0A9N8DVZ0_9STRA|nr:expressed unknown protein [Seminavis robusta]|eukprot:Sro413_g138170.1 n/a (497) ;mRNA; f:54253-55743
MDHQERPDPLASTASPSPAKAEKGRKKQSPAQPWKKPPGFPKRYLSAYNLFFKQERERLLKNKPGSEGGEGPDGDDAIPMKPELPDPNAPKAKGPRKHARSSGIGFANLARIVAKKWKTLDPALKAPFEEVANRDKERYKKEMVVWRAQQEKKKQSKENGSRGENGGDTKVSAMQHGDPKADPSLVPDISHAQPDAAQHGHESFHPSSPGSEARLPGRQSMPPSQHDAHLSAWNNYGAPPTHDRSLYAREADRHPPGSARYMEYDRPTSAFSPGPGGRRPEEDYYRYAWWDGYDYRYDHRYDRNFYAPPYAMPYHAQGRQMPGMHYRGPDAGRPMPMRHIPPTSSPYPQNGLGSSSFDGYYPQPPPPPPGHHPTAQQHPDNLPSQRKHYAQPPTYPPPPSHGKNRGTPPQAYHARQPNSPDSEETWQRPASRDHFEPPGNEPTSAASDSKRAAIAAAPSDSSQPLALKHQDGSEFETVETNLDNDTVDFLTTLELE